MLLVAFRHKPHYTKRTRGPTGWGDWRLLLAGRKQQGYKIAEASQNKEFDSRTFSRRSSWHSTRCVSSTSFDSNLSRPSTFPLHNWRVGFVFGQAFGISSSWGLRRRHVSFLCHNLTLS